MASSVTYPPPLAGQAAADGRTGGIDPRLGMRGAVCPTCRGGGVREASARNAGGGGCGGGRRSCSVEGSRVELRGERLARPLRCVGEVAGCKIGMCMQAIHFFFQVGSGILLGESGSRTGTARHEPGTFGSQGQCTLRKAKGAEPRAGAHPPASSSSVSCLPLTRNSLYAWALLLHALSAAAARGVGPG